MSSFSKDQIWSCQYKTDFDAPSTAVIDHMDAGWCSLISSVSHWKRLEHAHCLLGKSLVYTLRGHAEVAVSHFSELWVNIASRPRLLRFTVHVAARMKVVPVHLIVRWFVNVLSLIFGSFFRWEIQFYPTVSEFVVCLFVHFICHHCVIFLKGLHLKMRVRIVSCSCQAGQWVYISPKVTVCFATTDGHDDDNVCLVGISEHGDLDSKYCDIIIFSCSVYH